MRSGNEKVTIEQIELNAANLNRSSNISDRLSNCSTRKLPKCSSKRARHSNLTCDPGCIVAAIFLDAPPRTTPKWRPCVGVNVSIITEFSPYLRTDTITPSLVHSIIHIRRSSSYRPASVSHFYPQPQEPRDLNQI